MKIAGHCPMGCGTTLWATTGGGPATIVCMEPDCADPDAVSKILADDEREHIVRVNDTHFSLQHPLRERLGDPPEMTSCSVYAWLQAQSGPPVQPGVYRMIDDGQGDYEFEEVESP